MAKRSGLGQKFYAVQVGSGPAYDLSGDVGSIDGASSMFAVLDDTGIDKSAMERLVGVGDGSVAFTSFHNNAAGGSHAVLSLLNGLNVRAIWLGSATEGDGLAYALHGIMDNYPATRAQNGALTAKPSVKSSNGRYPDWGRLGAIGTDASGANNHTAMDFGNDPTQTGLTISSNSKAVASVVTTSVPHGYTSGDSVNILGSNSTVSIDGDWVVTVTGASTFTVPVDTSGGASAGTAGTARKTSLRLGCSLTAVLLSIGSGTNFTVKAQHSADNGVVDAFADLSGVVTTSLTAAAAESRAQGAATLLVKRYVRLVTAGTYTNSNFVGIFKRLAGAE